MSAKEEIVDTRQNGTSRREVKTGNLEDQRVCGKGLRNQPLLSSYECGGREFLQNDSESLSYQTLGGSS